MKHSISFLISVFFLTLLGLGSSFASDLRQDYYFDQAENLGIRFTLDSTRQTLRISFLEHLADLTHHQEKNAREFVEFFRKKIKVQVNSTWVKRFDEPISASAIDLIRKEKKVPKWTISLFLDRGDALKPLHLGNWTAHKKLDKFKKNTAQMQKQCKMGTYLVRELAQFEDREQTFSSWIENDPCYDSDHFTPRVDLHTHYTGTHRSETILDLASQSNIPVPTSYLIEMGIDPTQFKQASEGQVFLDQTKMSDGDKVRFKDAVSICPFKVITFIESEKLYANRKVVVDRPAISKEYLGEFKNSLTELAKDYNKNNVRYVEFSFADIVQPEFIKIAHEVVPQLEQTYQVRIRFKAAIRRNTTHEEMLAVIKRVIALNDPLIVGADFMGEENNSTASFAYAIGKLSEYRLTQRPHFAIQVHAGESDEFSGNVKKAIEAGATQIGHGIHGITDEVIDLAKKNGVIIEINLDSNLALNNVARMDALSQVVKRYLEKEVSVIFSTDGHGLYHSSSTSLYLALRRLGLKKSHFKVLRKTEKQYMEKMNAAFKEEMNSFDLKAHEEILNSGPFKKPIRQDAQILSRKKIQLLNEAKEKNIHVLKDSTEAMSFEPGKRPLFFMNPGSGAWIQNDIKKYEELSALIEGTLRKFDPKEYFVVTSGTAYGGDSLVYSHNKENPLRQWSVLGIVGLGIGLGRIERSNDALLLSSKMDWIGRNNEVLNFLVKRDGIIVVLGGNEKGKQMLQTAFSGLEGKSEASRFDVLVYKAATGKISGITPKFGPLAVFSTIEDLGEMAKRKGMISEKTLIEKPLPSYCELDSIQEVMSQEYLFTIPSSRVRQVPSLESAESKGSKESEGTKARFKQLLENRNYFSYPYPEEFNTVLSQSVIQNEFEKDQDIFSVPLNLELPGLIQFFSAMTEDEVYRYVQRRADRGKSMSQALAKVCIYLSYYAKSNPELVKSPSGLGLNVEPADNEESYEELVDKQKKYSEFFVSSLSSLSEIKPRKPVESGGPAQDSLLKKGESKQSAPKIKTLVLLRGLGGLEDFASKMRKEIDKLRPDLKVALVGSLPQFFDLKLKAYPQRRFWRPLRVDTLALNQKSVAELMSAETHVIVYADMNKSVSYMEPYARLAAEYGYQVKVIRVGDLSLENLKRYLKKHALFLIEKGQWYDDKVRLGGREIDQFIVQEDPAENAKYILMPEKN